MENILKKLNTTVQSIEKFLLVIMLIFMTILGAMQIISRFVIKSPIAWSEAMLTYIFIWVSFLGAGVALDQKSHFSVEILVERLPKGLQKIFEVIVYSLLIVVNVFITYKGVILVFENRNQMMSAMPFSMSWPVLVLPVSSVFMLIHLLHHIYCQFIGRE